MFLKTNKPIKLNLFIVFSLLTICSSVAQANKGWVSNDIFKLNYFIENNGQYNKLTNDDTPIKFGIENGINCIYFTPKGYNWNLAKRVLKEGYQAENKEADRQENTEAEWEKYDIHKLTVQMQWLQANDNVLITGTNKTHHYFSYGTSIGYGYSKITYHNLYNGIDVEYTIHPKGGIKYSLLVKPGADIGQLKYTFTINGKPLKTKLKNGKVEVENEIDYLIEQGIKAYYVDGTPVPFHYELNNGIIQLLPNVALDSSKPLVVDPWVSALSTLTGITNWGNKGNDIDHDIYGNLYVYGGGASSNVMSYSKLAKYDINGVLLWTFMGQVGTLWNSCPAPFDIIGNFAVDKSTQKLYISQGYAMNGATIVRLNQGGIYDNFISLPNTGFQEIWEMKINCVSGELLGFGGGTTSNINFGIVDTATGNISTSNITGLANAFQDISNVVINYNGEPYILFACSTGVSLSPPGNQIYKLNNSYTGSIWNILTGYTSLDEAFNRPYLTAQLGNTNGTNCLALNQTYLYYYDGFNLKAFNALTGSAVGTAMSISGQTPLFQLGIYANSCDEVFIGSNNGSILKYSFNGTSFSSLGSLLIAGQGGNSIYDLVYNNLNQLLYVAGDSFVAVVDPQTACAKNNYTFPLSQIVSCSNAIVAVQNPLPNSSYTFIWVDSLTQDTIRIISTPNGVFTDTITGVSGQVFHVTLVSALACQVVTSSISVTINCSDNSMFDNLIELAIPNAFSPNGDNKNDIFIAQGKAVNTITEFCIYNRWGERIFITKDYTKGWDGKYKKENQEVGVYVYTLDVVLKNGKHRTLKGNVQLLR